MEKFGTILRIIGFLILICLFGYGIYALFGWVGVIVYTGISYLAIGWSIIMMNCHHNSTEQSNRLDNMAP